MKKLALAALAAGTVLSAPASAATYMVDANTAGTSLGTVVSGRPYQFTATGIVDLVGDVIPGGSFNVNADGIPQPLVTDPNYPYFNPNGSTTADGQSGPLAGANFGSLIANFGGSTPYFLIGTNRTITFSQSGEIFGRINDINFNNRGSFDVTVTAVPEPATWGMMMLGLGLVGFGLRSRRKVATRVSFG